MRGLVCSFFCTVNRTLACPGSCVSGGPLGKFSLLVLWWRHDGFHKRMQTCCASLRRHAPRSGSTSGPWILSFGANFRAHPLRETNTPGASFTIRAPRRRCGQQHRPSFARSLRAFGAVKQLEHGGRVPDSRSQAVLAKVSCTHEAGVFFDMSRYAQKRKLPPHSHTAHRRDVWPHGILLDLIICSC